MPQKPVKPSGPSQFPDLHSGTLGISWVVQGVSSSHWCWQLTECCVPGWQDSAGSDLPRLENLQPAFALMAQTTGPVPLSACTRYWSATQLRDRPSLFTGWKYSSRSSSFSQKVAVVGLAAKGPVEDGECCSRSLGRRHQTLKPPGRMNRNRDHRTRPRADHNKLILHGKFSPKSRLRGQVATVAIRYGAVLCLPPYTVPASKWKLAVAHDKTKPSHTQHPSSCRLNLQRCRSAQSSKHKSIAEATANRQHPSF